MTYKTRTDAKFATPCLLSSALTPLAIWVTTTFADLPLRLSASTNKHAAGLIHLQQLLMHIPYCRHDRLDLVALVQKLKPCRVHVISAKEM